MTPQPPRTPDEHRLLREMLGVYALGHLSPAEAATVRAHLETCAECRAELAEIEPAVQALSHITATDVPPGEPPPDLAIRVAASVAGERHAQLRRRRSRMALLAAAAIPAVLTIGGIGAFVGHEVADDSIAALPAVPIEDVEVRTNAKRVDASAGVVAHTWGVEIKLQAVGLTRGDSYSAMVTTIDGRQRSAGAFVGTGKSPMNCNLNSDVLRDEAAKFEVLDENGKRVLTVDL